MASRQVSKFGRESDKLEQEADEMQRKLAELRDAMKVGREKKALPKKAPETGRIWGSANKGKKTSTATPNAATTGRKASSSSTPTSARSVPVSGARVEASSHGNRGSTSGTDVEPPSPAFSEAMKRINNFNLFSGAFGAGEDNKEDGNGNGEETLQYIDQARSNHEEAFKDIDDFKYDEEEEKRAYVEEMWRKNGRPNSAAFFTQIDGSRPSTVGSIDLGQEQRNPKSTSVAVIQAAFERDHRKGPSEEMCCGPDEELPPEAFQDEIQVQTSQPVNTKRDQFMDGLRAAVAFNYFDHLQIQKKVQEEHARLEQARLAAGMSE